jgi:hypothetical protein
VPVHDIRVSAELPACIDTTIYPPGWEVSIWLRDRSKIESRISDLLRRLDIALEDERDFIHARFAYDESLEIIAPVGQKSVDKFATVRDVFG